MVWFFEPTSDPNIEYEIVMQYDANELALSKVQYVQIEPPVMWDISNAWQEDEGTRSVISRLIRTVRNALELP